MDTDDRLAALTAWVRQFAGFEDAQPEPASDDASFRRYFRVLADQSYIVMDAPPPHESTERFVAIAGRLASMGLNSPRIVEFDAERGFVLMADLGSTQYLSALKADPARAGSLYRDAIDALIVMQAEGRAFQGELPPYDEKMIRFELSLFREWLCDRHLGIAFSDDDDRHWQATCDGLLDNLLAQPKVFVHRDYHSRNLMLNRYSNPGILDFQDAVEGPYAYDLVSLLKDCYVAWPESFVTEQAAYYLDRQTVVDRDRDAFIRDFHVAGVLRHVKASGIFARLMYRDGKPGYLKDIPRTLGYVADLRETLPELQWLVQLIDERIMPALGEST
jgi:aminoglycoside/choline kinase family phosphotransferase